MLMQTELVWLLGAVARGDETAFQRLYEATRAKLYGVLVRILGRPALAEEVMEETYLKVWKMADQFDPATASPITWMVAMARNRVIGRDNTLPWRLPADMRATREASGWNTAEPRPTSAAAMSSASKLDARASNTIPTRVKPMPAASE